MTETAVKGITDAQLSRLLSEGWEDMDWNQPGWKRWVAYGRYACEQRIMFDEDSGSWEADPNGLDDYCPTVSYHTFEDAMGQLEEWRDKTSIQPSAGTATKQAGKFAFVKDGGW